MEPGTRRLVVIAGVLGVGLVAVFAASGLVHRHSSEIPVVQADSRPIRVKPDNPGGLQVPNANNEVFSGGSDTDGSKLAPTPEVPNPTAMRAPPPPQAAAAPVPAAAAPAAPMTALPQPPPAAVSEPARPTRSARATTEVPAEPPAPPHVQAAIETRPVPATSGRGAVVQLAALTTEEAARAEWQQLAKRMPELLGGHQPVFSRTERDGHTFWRVRTAGFADVAQARSFCEHVRAKGGGCSVAEF